MDHLEADRQDPSSAGLLLVFVLITAGVMTHYGAFKWYGLLMMVCALGLAVWLHLRPGLRAVSADGLLLGIVLAFLAAITYTRSGQNEIYEIYRLPGVARPFKHVNAYGMAIRFLATGAFIMALTYLAAAWDRMRWIARGRFFALLLIAVSFRPLILRSAPIPRIDVFVSQTLGAKGLLLKLTPATARNARLKRYAETPSEARTLGKSLNVYSMTFPSPYWSEERLGPRFDRYGKPLRGAWFDHYAYPPSTLYANALSWLAFGDVRMGWAICDLIGALCIYLLAARMSPGPKHRRFRELLTLAFLCMPRSLFVLEQSWTEPLMAAALGVVALVLARPTHPLIRGVALGVFFSSKQYSVLAGPLLLKLRRCRLPAWVVGAIVGVALALPFALWNWDAIWNDLVGFFLKSEGRPDGLSVYAAVKRFGHEIPWWVVAPTWLGGVGFFSWRMKRTLAGMLFSSASVWLFFFMLGKQAFINYWHLILFTLLLAVAATPQEPPAPSEGFHKAAG